MLWAIYFELRKEVKALRIDGKVPSSENVLNGSRNKAPADDRNKGDPDAIEQEFIDFMFSEEGKAVIGREAIPVERNR